MSRATIIKSLNSILTSLFIVLALLFSQNQLHAKSLDFPTSKYGISIGNSENFTGLRINWRDRDVEEIRGVNLTLWVPGREGNKQAEITGISLGLMPSGGNLTGLNLGLSGLVAENNLEGVNLGLIGMGSGNDDGKHFN